MKGLSPVAARVARAQVRAHGVSPASGVQFELFDASSPLPVNTAAPVPKRTQAQVRRHPSDPARVRVFGNFAQVCAALEALCASAPSVAASA